MIGRLALGYFGASTQMMLSPGFEDTILFGHSGVPPTCSTSTVKLLGDSEGIVTDSEGAVPVPRPGLCAGSDEQPKSPVNSTATTATDLAFFTARA